MLLTLQKSYTDWARRIRLRKYDASALVEISSTRVLGVL